MHKPIVKRNPRTGQKLELSMIKDVEDPKQDALQHIQGNQNELL